MCNVLVDRHLIFISNRVSELLETTSLEQWIHVTTSDIADAGTSGTSAVILQYSSWVKCPNFKRFEHLTFELNTAVIDNIELGVVTDEEDNNISSLTASATKRVN